MKTLIYTALFTLLFFAVAANASPLIFYGGDFDPNNPNADGLANENDASVAQQWASFPVGAATYQNFVLHKPTLVTGLFTNNLSDLNPVAGYWEIRTKVHQGWPGKLIASGNSVLTQTATGRSGFGYTEYQDLVGCGLASCASPLNVHLKPGQYWFSVVPQDPATAGRSFNSNTLGNNAIGSQINNQQYFDSPFFGAFFDNANNWGVFRTFSSGVYDDPLYDDESYGDSAPEPSSLIRLGSGLASVAGAVRSKLNR